MTPQSRVHWHERIVSVRMRVRGRWRLAVAALVASAALSAPSLAVAQELATSISAAEARVESARSEVDELKAVLGPALTRYAAVSRRARPARAEKRDASHRITQVEARGRAAHAQAVARIHRIEVGNRKSEEKHNEEVATRVGLGIAVLVVGLIALGWGWFRATSAVAGLTRITLARAVGLCVGGGFLAVFIGAALQEAEGLPAVVGGALVPLGLMLPVAFLLARHSAEIQRGRAKPLLRHERFPSRVTQAVAAVFGVFCLIAFGSAIFVPAAQSDDVPASLRVEAHAAGWRSSALVAAKAEALRVERMAAPLLAAQRHARRDLRRARRTLGQAESRMAAAEGQVRSFSRQLVAFELRERREAEREERRAQREREKEEREATREAEEIEEAEACDPNYEGACLHQGIGDYDCAGGSGDGPNYVSGPIYVVGIDEFGLDSDGDGVACEDG